MMVSFAWKRSDSNAWKELGGGGGAKSSERLVTSGARDRRGS